MSDLNDLAERVVSWAQNDEAVEAYVSHGVSFEAVAYEQSIESLSQSETIGIGVRVVKDHRVGFAYAESLDESALRDTLVEARENARYASFDEFAGIAKPDGVTPVSIDLWDDRLVVFSPEAKIRLALDLERATLSKDSRVSRVRESEYGDGYSEYAIATTTGIRAQARSTGCYVAVSALAGEGDETQAGGGYSVRRAPEDIDLDEAATRAAEQSTRLLGAVKPKSTRLSVLFDNRVTPTLLGALSTALNGENVEKGRSFFANKLNESVAINNFTLYDDATDTRAYGASAFDGEGLASRKNVLIENGVLKSFLYDSYSANRAGVASNGSAIRGGFRSGPSVGARALVLQPGGQSQDEMIADIEYGVLVQSVLGASTGGINPISGDLSLGAVGLMIRDGRLEEPVREFTIASTIQEMLYNISVIGGDLEWLPGSIAGSSVVVTDMTLSGT